MNAEKFLVLKEEISRYSKAMTQASTVIRDKDVSNYPIFVAHQQEFDMGIVIVDHTTSPEKWSIHASTLEEFVSKQIIHDDKIEEFTSNFKDPDEENCIFVLSDLGAQFIFLPIKKES